MDGTSAGRTTRWGIEVVDFLLIASTLVVFVFWVAVPLLGPAGLGLLNGSICEPSVCGRYLSVDADLLPGPWFTALPETNATYDFGAQMTINVNAYDNFWHAPIGLLLAGLVLKGLVACGVLISMILILRSLRAGDPFTRRNARIVMLIAVLVGLGGQTAALLTAWGRYEVLYQPDVAAFVEHNFSVSLLPLACGLVIAVFAEVFRRGAAMHADVEGLV